MKRTTLTVLLQDDTTFMMTLESETDVSVADVVSYLASRQGFAVNGNEIWPNSMVKKYTVSAMNEEIA